MQRNDRLSKRIWRALFPEKIGVAWEEAIANTVRDGAADQQVGPDRITFAPEKMRIDMPYGYTLSDIRCVAFKRVGDHLDFYELVI